MKWEVSTFSKFVIPTDVKISKDGNWIAYCLKRTLLEDNKYERLIVLENIEKNEKYFLETGSSMPTFSPDSKKMLYTKPIENSKEVEIRLLELETLSSRFLFKTKELNFMRWADDSRKVLLVSTKRRGDEDLYFEEKVPVWFDRIGFLDSPKNVLKIIDTESGQVIEEFEAENVVSAVWNNEAVIYSKASDQKPFEEFDIFEYKDGSKKVLFEKVGFYAVDSYDSALVLFGQKKKSNHFAHSYVYLFENGELRDLTGKFGLDNAGHVSTEIWATESMGYPVIDYEKNIYFKSGIGGKIVLEKIDSKGETKETLVNGEGVVTAFDVSSEGKIVYIWVDSENPAEVYLNEGNSVRKITELNFEISRRLKIRKLNHFKYKSFDGVEIDGWYLKPDKIPAPLIVFVHGGPKGAYGYSLNFFGQLLAEEGFYVLYTNPRGSDNYSEEFAAAVKHKTGLEDFEDIMAGVNYLLQNEPVKKDEVGITGISYGGFMTNWAITHSDLFKAAVSENGVSYWFTSYSFSDIGFWFDKELIGDDPLKDENYRKLSPIFYSENVKAPVLIIHSLEDYRCPLDQSLMFHTVLKQLNKESYIAIFKKGAHGHSITGLPRHRLKRYKLILKFFKEKLLEKKQGFDVDEILKD
ncbi:MAG: hypothetical protein PWQ48_1835 [Thermotogaceae bacterium]|nr:hypothetical protein [Thermotogaceae bacterium]